MGFKIKKTVNGETVWEPIKAKKYTTSKTTEYTDSLPITISANGDTLLDYRIYGADSDVGEQTENLLDYSKCESGAIGEKGNIGHMRNNSEVSDYIDVSGESYVVIAQNRLHNTTLDDQYMAIGCWDENYAFISNSRSYKHVESTVPSELCTLVKQLPSGTKYVRANFLTNNAHESIESVDAMIILGSDIPTSYIPYGYKLPMTVIDNLAPPLSQWVDGYITVSGSISPPLGARREKSSDFIEVKPNTKYVFGIEGGAFPHGTDGKWVASGLYRDDRTFIRRTSTDRDSPFTFLTSSETKYIRLSYRTYGELWEPRLSENSFSISVYIGENKLDSIEGISDYVDKSSGKIIRCIKEYTFTGDEPIEAYYEGFLWMRAFPGADSTGNIITTRFSHFTARKNCPISILRSNAFGDNCACIRTNEPDFLFRSTANFTTVEECKAYLKAQYDNGTPVKMWYIMKTPIEEDPPVPFPEIPTVDGTTIIDYDGEPKPSEMYVKYNSWSGWKDIEDAYDRVNGNWE